MKVLFGNLLDFERNHSGEKSFFSVGFFKDLLMIEDFNFYLILVEGSFIHGDN